MICGGIQEIIGGKTGERITLLGMFDNNMQKDQNHQLIVADGFDLFIRFIFFFGRFAVS